MDFLILFICGAVIGLFSSFFGIGGGALIVPVLYELYPKITDTVVISTSLGTIFFITIINSMNFYREGLTPKKSVAMTLMITTLIGGLIGAKLTYLIDTSVSKKVIASILILIVIKNLFMRPTQATSEKPSRETSLNIALTGFFGAFVSSMTGLGGGIIFVPMLLSLVRLKPIKISAYSNLAMAFATFIGCLPHLFTTIAQTNVVTPSLGDFFVGQVNFAIVFILAFSAFFTSKLGVKYNDRVSTTKKKIFLSIVLLTLSLKMFFI